jgi:hypothetical protein
LASGADCGSQRVVARVADAHPRRDLDRPECLRHPHVPDPGDEPLILERLPEPPAGGTAQPRDGGVEVDLGGEHVLAEPADWTGLERQHRAVPEDAFELVATKHEPRSSHPLLASRLDPPAPGHPQMTPHDDPSFEPEQEMLADGLDRLQHPPVDAFRHAGRPAARIRRLDLQPLSDERLQTARGTVKRVALGHCGEA